MREGRREVEVAAYKFHTFWKTRSIETFLLLGRRCEGNEGSWGILEDGWVTGRALTAMEKHTRVVANHATPSDLRRATVGIERLSHLNHQGPWMLLCRGDEQRVMTGHRITAKDLRHGTAAMTLMWTPPTAPRIQTRVQIRRGMCT